MEASRVSVVVPVYNAETYLERCVSSLLTQSYPNLEIILVDDGSADRSGELCDRYADQDVRVRVIHQKNGGAAAARNAGLAVVSGEYVAFVDSDDYLDAGMYQSMLETAQRHDCDLVLCDCVKEDRGRSELYSHAIRGGLYSKEQMLQEYFPQLLMTPMVDYPSTISNCVLLIRTELIRKHALHYLDGMTYSEDLMFGAQLAYYADCFYYMKGQALYHYVFHSDSVTHGVFQDRWPFLQELYQHISTFFRSVQDYDLGLQLDRCLLFFVYHAIGTIYSSSLSNSQKKCSILNILKDKQVEEMLSAISLKHVKLSKKQKWITLFYRHQRGIGWLVRYYSKRERDKKCRL